MTGTAQVQLKSSDTGVLLLPSSALSPTTDGKLSVWIFDPETTLVHRRMITTGAPTQDGVPVLAGLTSGEQIVVAGAHQLQEGMQVRPL
jgi:multidrug efflux pump subunit AcrA (membrane-fusion protein)